MIGKICACLKKRLARWMLLIEFCSDCGRRVDQVWTAHDEIWLRLNDDQENGCLCIGCFDKRAEAHGCHLRWEPRIDYVLNNGKWDPEWPKSGDIPR